MRKVFSVLVIAAIAVSTVWAQDDEALGVTVSTELSFGNVAYPRYALVTTGTADDDGVYREGQGSWMLPQIEYTRTVGTLTFDGLLRADLTNGGSSNDFYPRYALHRDTMAKFTYRPDERVKLWATMGDGQLFRFGGGRSAFDGVLLPSIEILLDAQGLQGGAFNLNQGYVVIRPRLDITAGIFGAYLFLDFEPVNDHFYAPETNTRAIKQLEFRVDFTFSRLYLELTCNIPTGVFSDKGPHYDDATVSAVDPNEPISIRHKGVTITPKLKFSIFDNLKVWVAFDLGGLGRQTYMLNRGGVPYPVHSSDYDFSAIEFVPYLGLSYSL